jgi:ABC-2 type transport system ATP-binding protein
MDRTQPRAQGSTAFVHEQFGGAAPPESHADDVVLEVVELTKQYGSRLAVDRLTFAVCRGEIFGFLGPNGAGKTTSIAMILGLLAPSAGSVRILGRPLTRGDTSALRRVGAIVETPAFYPYLSAYDNLRVLAGVRGGVPAGRIAEALERVGLSARAHNRVGSFSLGMKQRLGLAGALLHRPALLILDEPSNGLDPAGIVAMRQLLLDLAREGTTILLCSHLLAEVQQVCDRVLILAEGLMVAQGEVTHLLRRGAHTRLRVDNLPLAERLLCEAAWVEGVVRDGDALLVTMSGAHDLTLGRLLAANGLIVLELRRQELDLERLFLALTGQPRERGSS